MLGKQDPYATVTYRTDKKRTPVDKKGGQHPIWDAELRFEIFEDMEDELSKGTTSMIEATPSGGIAPRKDDGRSNGGGGGSAGGGGVESVKVKSAGSKALRLAIYADDSREPDLICEGTVDISDTLKKGEFDGEFSRVLSIFFSSSPEHAGLPSRSVHAFADHPHNPRGIAVS